MEYLLSVELWLAAALIFGLRVVNMALDTVRALMVMRNQKKLVWILGFLQTIIFVYALNTVIDDLGNIVNLMAYSAGFASGNVVGMWIEEKIAMGYVRVQVISSKYGSALVDALRSHSYGVTEFPGRGKDGAVSMISTGVLRKDVQKVLDLVNEIDQEAFITTENLQPIRRGFFRAHK